MQYTIKQLADAAGISVRTLRYYDQIGLLKPTSHTDTGYRLYGTDRVLRLQQVLFYRELGFNLKSIADVLDQRDFDVLAALSDHRRLLQKKKDRLQRLLATVDTTITALRGETGMDIRDYYRGFTDEQIEEYRKEVQERWGDETLRSSEERVVNMGCDEFASLQAEGGAIFRGIADSMDKGVGSPEVQALVGRWREWLEHFHAYTDEAVLGLGRMYSEDERFAGFFREYGEGMPEFLARAIEYYYAAR